jgi:terminase small subunit-like protein
MADDKADKPTGRPCEYTAEIADAICAQLAHGESLRSVCDDADMPCVKTVFNWMRRFPEFLAQYARAKEESADALAEEILDIADDGRNDWMEKLDDSSKGRGWVLNGEHVQRSRVRIDTRKWLASKLKPRKYGEKVDLTHMGPNGGPVSLSVGYITPDTTTSET